MEKKITRKSKSKVTAFKLSALLNGLDLNETVQARQDAIRVGKAEYKRTFTSDYFLNLEHNALPVVKSIVDSYFADYKDKLQFSLEYDIESREFSLKVRAKHRIHKAKTVSESVAV